MNWLQAQLSRHEFGLRNNVLKSEFLNKLQAVELEATSNRGRFSPVLLGNIQQAFNDNWLVELKSIVKNEQVFKSLLSINIWADGRYGCKTGTLNGEQVITIAPEQAEIDYIPCLLHEIKHVIDILNNKKVDLTDGLDYPVYNKLPSERRARDFESSFINRLYKKQNTYNIFRKKAQQYYTDIGHGYGRDQFGNSIELRQMLDNIIYWWWDGKKINTKIRTHQYETHEDIFVENLQDTDKIEACGRVDVRNKIGSVALFSALGEDKRILSALIEKFPGIKFTVFPYGMNKAYSFQEFWEQLEKL